jgi:hypothetical protein
MKNASAHRTNLNAICLVLFSVVLCGCPVNSLAPPSRITISVSPTSATAGDPPVTITVTALGGARFDSGEFVRLKGKKVDTTRVDSSTLTAVIPADLLANPGTIAVDLADSQGSNSNTVNFVVNGLPTIAVINPSSVAAGGPGFTLIITGTGFVAGAMVRFELLPRAAQVVSSMQINVAITASDIAIVNFIPISVINPGNKESNTVFLSVTGTPTITSISPTSVTVNSGNFTLTVNGTNYSQGSAVQLSGAALTTTLVSGTQLTASVPNSLIQQVGSFPVTVKDPNNGGSTSNAVSLTVTAVPVPTLTSISPSTVTAGGSGFFLTATGTGFVPSSVVLINGTARTTTFISATQIEATILSTDVANPGTAQITVMTPAPGGGTSNAATLTITANTGNHDSLLNGVNVLYLIGVDTGEAPVTIMVSYNADGNGGGTNCLATVNASTIVNNAPCTFNYNVDNSNVVTMTATVTGQSTPFTFAGNLVPSSGNVGIILTGGPANLVSSASGDSFKQDPTAFTLSAQQGQRFFVFGGKWNGSFFTGLGQGIFDNAGNANPINLDFAQPGSFQFQSGDALTLLNGISATSGCGNGISSFLGTPPIFESFQSNEVTCIVDLHSFLKLGTDPPSASVPDRLRVIAHDSLNRDVGNHSIRRATLRPQGSQETAAESLAAAAAVANPAQLNGAYTARLQGVSGSGASATNSIMLFKFLADGAGNITFGILDQINGGTLTSSVSLAGSTYTVDATTPGRVIIHLNSNGTTLIDNDFTAYIGASAGGSIMAGTTAHPSTQLGIGVVTPQGGFPFSAASFGSGCPVTSVHPVATSNWTLTGSMDFSAGITNFNSTFSFVKGGTPTSGQAVTGTFTLTDPNTGRFTGNLTGFPGTTGAVVGYLNGPNLFSFALSTSSTSSALITCVGQ